MSVNEISVKELGYKSVAKTMKMTSIGQGCSNLNHER